MSSSQVNFDFEFEETPDLPARSALLPVYPIGLGTWQVESLASFLDRLIHAHGIPMARLKAIALESISIQPDQIGLQCLYANLWGERIGGMCANTRAWVEGLNILLSTKVIAGTTLLTLEGRVSNRNLIAPKRRHCPKCTQERGIGKHTHHLLLWMIDAVSVCPVHGCRLEIVHGELEYARARWRFRNDPTPDKDKNIHDEGPDADDDMRRELGRSRLIATFLQSQLFRHGAKVTPEQSVAGFLKATCRVLYHGVGSHLARQLLIGKGGLHDWMTGQHLPSFGQVVDIAQSLDTSIEAVLLGATNQLPLFPPEYTKRMAKRAHVNHNIGSEKFRIKLLTIIRLRQKEKGPFAPISISEIARTMGVDRKSLVLAYPDIAKQQSFDYRKKRATITRLTQSVRHHAYREAAIILAQHGKLPTRNRVMNLLKEISVFSLHDIRVCHRICLEVREEFHIQGRR